MINSLRPEPKPKVFGQFPKHWSDVIKPTVGSILVTVFLISIGLPLPAQELPQRAMAVFPADTDQVAYANLGELRDMPEYSVIRQGFLLREMDPLLNMLRLVTTDPESQVDEIMLGWHSRAAPGGSAPFGLGLGNFDLEGARKKVGKGKLHVLDYRGFRLEAADSSLHHDLLYFTLLDQNTLAFGRLADLETMLKVWAGEQSGLNENSAFVDYEAELENSAPEWGITTGEGATNFAVPLLAKRGLAAVEARSLASPVVAVLYGLEWGGQFRLSLFVICKRADNAALLARVLGLLRDSGLAAAGAAGPVARFIETLEVDQDGNRVEIEGTAPLNVFGLLLPPQPGSPWKPPSGVKANAHQ